MGPIQGPSTVCSVPAVAKGFTASASNNPTSYSWMVLPSTGVIISSPNSSVTSISFPNTNSTYTIFCSASNGLGMSLPVTHNVTVYETPVVSFSGVNIFCQGSSTNLSASPTIISASSTLFYNWSPSTGLSSTTSGTVTANPPTSTNYSVLLTIGACTNMAYVNVTVNPLPNFTVTSSPTVTCKAQNATITINGSATSYTLYKMSSMPPTTLLISPTVTTQYTVMGTDANGCERLVIHTHSVISCIGLSELNSDNGFIIYPNPSDGTFMINAVKDETILIFNDTGQLIRKVDLVVSGNNEVANLPRGIYFLIGENKRQKIIVTK
jgi:hypothetical protein